MIRSFLLLFSFWKTIAYTCKVYSCPPGSSLEQGPGWQYCWWFAEPGVYWVCNGTDIFDTTYNDCVNAYPSILPNCTANHTFMEYNNTEMCVEFYNQTYSECPQGYTLDIPGEGRWTCNMWTTPFCNNTVE